MLNQGLDYAAFVMYLYHVTADHYTLSPTKVVLRSKPWKDVAKDVEINDTALEMVLESARNILKYLERY